MVRGDSRNDVVYDNRFFWNGLAMSREKRHGTCLPGARY